MSKKTACCQVHTFILQKGIFLMILLLPFISLRAQEMQAPKVPANMDFAGMKLKISEQARKDIQSDVDALYRSEKYFNIKVDRVDLYFPIIERILKEEGVPDDLKYLVIQESSLISDAVSSSNAVGFWQFKQDAGEEVGLKINAHVDERMNIVSSTRGAATYLKKHNSYFDNWVYSLLAYYLGRGGAKSVVEPKLFGADKMDIDKKTNWYILKFLAHKVAFEHALKKNDNPSLILAEYTTGADKSLKVISQETEVELEILEHYNKWLKKGKVPLDKSYAVILPISPVKEKEILVVSTEQPEEKTLLPRERGGSPPADTYPKIDGDVSNRNEPLLVNINGRPGIISREGDGVAAMASFGGIKEERFRKINDILSGHKVKEGQYYYFKPKKNNAPIHYHTVQHGETLWDISQMYGIKIKKILRKNRMSDSGTIRTGMVLWLRYIRPANEAVTYRDVEPSEGKSKQNTKEANKKVTVQEEDATAVLSQERSHTESRKETTEKATIEKNKPAAIPADDEKILEESPLEEPVADLEEPVEDSIEPGEIPVIQEPVQQERKPQEETKKDSKQETDPYENDKVTFVDSEKAEVTEEKNDKHVVQQGETLYGISRQYGVPLQDLAEWNGLKFNESIKIGQTILVNSPAKVTEEVARDVRKTPEKLQENIILHKVLAGETLYKIARDHNVTIKEVMEWNGKTDFNVALGEVIKIKKMIGNE